MKWFGSLFAVTLPILTWASAGLDSVREVLEPLRPGEIVARGWLREQLKLVKDGLGGHLDEIEPDQMARPYVTRDFNPANGARGLVAWCAEMGGEFALGSAMLGLALDDAELIAENAERVKRAMALQEPDGYLGAYRQNDDRFDDFNPWGCHWFYGSMLLEYGRTGNREILEAVRRGLRWFAKNWAGERKTDYAGATIVETCSVVYRLTGDREILQFALDYADWLDRHGDKKGKFTVFPTGKHAMHVAALGARLKLPVALALAANRPDYLSAAESFLMGYRENPGWQATYAPCADGEWTAAPSCVGESEYCDFVFFLEVFTWLERVTGKTAYGDMAERMVFNAAQGARAKDERTIAYMSSPNQWYATDRSVREGPESYFGVYAPNVNPACCPANSIRLYPRYILDAVAREGGDLRVSHYGPYAVRTTVGGAAVSVESETDYPFDGRIDLRIRAEGWAGSLRLRRPAWAETVRVARNGVDCPVAEDGSVIVVRGPWKGDETVRIEFGWNPVVRKVCDRDFPRVPLRTVEWGALVFSQRIGERWTKTTRPKPSWGKDEAPPQPADWPWFNVSCTSEPVPYAIPADLDARTIRVRREKGDAVPWRRSPVRLEVPMLRTSNAYPAETRDGVHTPMPAANPVPKEGEVEYVELTPFGSTTLRVTCFPVTSEDCGTLALQAPDVDQAAREDSVRPVRQGGVNGQAYWNGLSVMFQYPPSFDFPKIEGAVSYRYVAEDDARQELSFKDKTPNETLAPIWAGLPTGFVRLEVRGLDAGGRVMGVAGSRRFWKSEPFSSAICPESAWSYDTAVGKYYDWLFSMTNTQMLATTGETDEYYLYNTYPAKTESALVHAFLRMAKRTPERRETLLKAARNAADFLLSYSNPPGSALECFPHTYRVLKPESSRKGVTSERYAGQNMLVYPATAGSAYLALYEAVKDEKYLTAAKRIAATYRRLQGEDGTWYLKLWEKDASPVVPNRLLPLGVCSFLEKLHELTEDEVFREMSDRAFAYVERGPLATWNWEAQFEDTNPSRPFRNMSLHHPCDSALHLLRRYPGDLERIAKARELLRFAEDQFVSWKDPFTEDGRGPLVGDTTMCPRASKESWYGLPGAFEQYDWYLPIDSSAAKMIRLYLALYRAEGRALDLAKARALGNAVTRIQKIAGNGAIPTHWVRWDVESDAKHWVNCGIATVQALEELECFSASPVEEGP